MDTVPDALDRLRQTAHDGRLATWCDAHGIAVVTVFGSAITTPSSAADLDVGIIPLRGTDVDLVAAWHALSELIGPIELDLVDASAAEPVLASRVLLGEPLYERTARDFVRARDASLLREMDTRWFRDLDLDLALPR